MSRKKVLSVTKKTPYDSADRPNHEGFPAWSMPDLERLRQALFCGTNGNTFYVTAESSIADQIKGDKGNIKQLLDDISRIVRENPDAAKEIIVQARNDGFMRTYPIYALVVLSQINIKAFQEIFNKVIRTGNDLSDYLDFARSMGGLGQGKKKAIQGWLDKNLNSHYAIKYGKQIADAIRLCRFPAKNPLYDYVMVSKKGVTTVEGGKGVAESKLIKAGQDYPQILAQEYTKKLLESGDVDNAYKQILEFRLDPMTIIGSGKMNQKLWQAVATQMGVMQYLKYIAALIRNKAFDFSLLKEKLTAANLKKAKVFPYRLWVAFESLCREFDKGSLLHIEDANLYQTAKVLPYISDVLDNYIQQYDWGAWKDKVLCIAPDVSGSMVGEVKNINGDKKKTISPAIQAGVLSAFLVRGIGGNNIFMPWAVGVEREVILNFSRAKTAVEAIKAVASAPGGGTSMSSPVEALLKANMGVDYLILITDSEEWVNRGFLPTWMEYRKKHPRARAILIRVDAYPTNPYSQEDAQKHGIFQVFGWNDSVFKWIEAVPFKTPL